MKAGQVLKRYAEGERNFQRVNLRGQSFKGKDLSGVDFSNADIRSTDFTDANLQGANFTGTKAGLQRHWAIFLVIVSLLLSGLSGSISGLAGYIAAQGFDAFQSSNQIAGWAVITALVTFFLLTIRYGIQVGLGVVAGAFAVTGVLAVTNVAPLIVFGNAASIGIGSVAGAGAGALAVASAGTFSLAGAIIGSVAGVIAGILIVDGAKVFTAAFTFAGAVVLLSFYISWQAMKGNEKYTIVRNIAIAFAATGGTSFRNANITDTDFNYATLKSTDFRGATLIRTCWYNAKKLDRVRPGTTYLSNQKLRQLLITREGQNENFDRLDLRGVNLQGAKLENASFIDADFYQANLQGANLSRAILVRANFERADLRGAKLTGSCIQDWVITESTKLDGIACDYVYLRWVDRDKRDQMPPRGKFKEGGFVTFVRYILETVELYHEKDINPRLALTVLQKMSRDYDEPLDIVALGKKGERVFLQVKVSENITQEKENFKKDYYSRYDTDLKLWSGNIHQLPHPVNSFIEKRISEIASERADNFVFVDATYAEGNYTEIHQGEVNMSGDRHIQVGRDYRETHVDDQGTYVEGNYYNNPEQKQTLSQAAAEIQKLLKQLEQNNPDATEDDKIAYVNDETTPSFKRRVVGALKAGGETAIDEFFNNPYVKVGKAIVMAWIQP